MENKTYVTKPLYNIEAGMSNYVDRLDRAERYVNGYSGNGHLTNEDLWNRGDMSYSMHNYLNEQREKLKKQRKILVRN